VLSVYLITSLTVFYLPLIWNFEPTYIIVILLLGLGVVLLTVATVATSGLTFGKGLVLIALLLLTAPVATHAIASAAYRIGIPMRRAVRDVLEIEVSDTSRAK